MIGPLLPSAATIASWPVFTPESPLRILVSGCLAGRPCGVDGTSYGEHRTAAVLLGLPNVRAADFCPEQVAFGVPRATPNIRGGDGFDVLDGVDTRVTIPMPGRSESLNLGMAASILLYEARRQRAGVLSP